MSTLQRIENEIAQLSAVDFRQLLQWMQEHAADAWDAEIERDILAGRFDDMFDVALKEDAEGKSLPL